VVVVVVQSKANPLLLAMAAVGVVISSVIVTVSVDSHPVVPLVTVKV